ncbi:MAG: MBL fold metallo-hydrolase [Calditrichales bacterium]|nr:MAG: MBL fold metallo-hydrolase [Calditrichales bacterium]
MPYIKFWGVRGSIPTPGPSTSRYGGNTSCVELSYAEDKFFILDAGSGIREFGQYLMTLGKPVSSHIFISHMHWDHIQGIPFFVPAYIPGNEFIFHGAQEADHSLEEILADQMNPVNFPIQLEQMASKFRFEPIFEGDYEFEGIKVETLYLNHPGYALGYRFHVNGKSVVYISDNEPYPVHPRAAVETDDPGELLFIDDNNQRLINFIKDVDVLIHDAQYTPEEFKTKIKWGHSPYDYTVKIALSAGVKTLVLFHHDPVHDDAFVDSIVEASKKISWQAGSKMQIIGAQEGMEIPLD